MNTERNHENPITILGCSSYYEVRNYTHTDGGSWLELSQNSSDGTYSNSIYIEPGVLFAVCDALEQTLGVSRAELAKTTPRGLAKHLEFLEGRNAGERWDKGEESLMTHLLLEGYAPEDIAVRLGRTRSAVVARMERLGFYEEIVLEGASGC